MREALDYFIRVFIKQGIWIGGVAWLFAVGCKAIFARSDDVVKSDEDAPEGVKKIIIMGAIILIIGIVVSF